MSEVITVNPPTKKIMSTPLSEATLQELHLELIRRRHFHAFDGQRVADCLVQHRDLWVAVMMDRVPISHPGSGLGLRELGRVSGSAMSRRSACFSLFVDELTRSTTALPCVCFAP